MDTRNVAVVRRNSRQGLYEKILTKQRFSDGYIDVGEHGYVVPAENNDRYFWYIDESDPFTDENRDDLIPDKNLTHQEKYEKYGILHPNEEELWERFGDDWIWGNDE